MQICCLKESRIQSSNSNMIFINKTIKFEEESDKVRYT